MTQKYLRKIKAVTRFCQRIVKKAISALNRQIIHLLRTISGRNRRRGSLNQGFILPTVVLVSLVVVLLTTAILFRAFDRSKNASNVRVNEIVMRAAAPAIDRAKAKLNQLFIDPRLPRSTPSDAALTQVMEGNISSYTFADETQLRLYYPVDSTYNINGASSGASTDNNINTAWKYPVDTDGNGKFDSFTLYGIYFRTPEQTRPRTPLESRAEPMDEGVVSTSCTTAVATSANLVGTQGWYKVGSKLKRSIFVYTVTVPITDITTPNLSTNTFEVFQGARGFSALEYQQDRERLPLTNSAVIYDNDLQIAPGAGLLLNGRIFTNGNLLTYAPYQSTNPINFYLVSSPSSCYFKQENSKIVVGGNVIGSIITSTSKPTGTSTLDLFNASANSTYYASAASPSTETGGNGSGSGSTYAYISASNQTIPTTGSVTLGSQAAYNDLAYSQRINKLVNDAVAAYPISSSYPGSLSSLPQEVQTGIVNELISTYGATNTTTSSTTANAAQILASEQDQLTIYFQKSARRVPYSEVALVPTSGGNTALKRTTGSLTYDYTTSSSIQGSGDSSPTGPLRPVDAWVYPFISSSGSTIDGSSSATTGIAVSAQSSGTKLYFPATDIATLAAQTTIQENLIGDRVLVGNGLPQYWLANTTNNPNATTNGFTNSQSGQSISTGQNIYSSANAATTGYQWDNDTTTRQRYSQSYHLDNLGDTGRNGFWETAAAAQPSGSLDVQGGLRVVTGVGIYLPNDYNSSAHTFTGTQTVVWPDSMPTGVKYASNSPPYSNPPYPLNPSSQYGLPNDKTPYLQMRATVVYHYLNSSYPNTAGTDQQPLACVSSFYDPSSALSARNKTSLPDVSPIQATPTSNAWGMSSYPLGSNHSLGRSLTGVNNVAGNTLYPTGNSNNGVVYAVPSLASNGSISTAGYLKELNYQAGLTYPNSNQINNGSSNPYYASTIFGNGDGIAVGGSTTNPKGGGRLVNPLLATALTKITNGTTLTLGEQSAIDSAMCALKILDGSIGSPTDAKVPHGAIMETTLLDGRQVKAVDQNSTVAKEISNQLAGTTTTTSTPPTPPYDLDVELRQPLEIRLTVLDMDLLRRTTVGTTPDGTTEYLLPNAGIIYATRDDALSDNSYYQDPSINISTPSNPNYASNSNYVSSNAADFIVDPTRRPHGILLVNGSKISRGTANNYIAAEKGLTLASGLPVYVQADTTAAFNHHSNQEYTTLLNIGTPLTTWNNFYTRTSANVDPQFACRAGQFSTCTTGENWRATTVLSDAITVLSNNFQLGYRSDGDYNLRDNYGNNPIGYDLNSDGTIGTTAFNVLDPGKTLGYYLDEIDLQFDVDGDGSISNTQVQTINEKTVGVDINSNGQLDTTSVPITESNITATVAARLNGFWDNNFVTSRLFKDSDYSNPTAYQPSNSTKYPSGSSYFNNNVTPIQRRGTFPEYLMEICPKLVVTACNSNTTTSTTDWVVGYDLNHNGTFTDAGETAIIANNLLGTIQTYNMANNTSYTFNKQYLWSGTTAQAAALNASSSSEQTLAQTYPRRVAFLRYDNSTITSSNVLEGNQSLYKAVLGKNGTPVFNSLVLDSDFTPVPIGMFNGQINYYPYSHPLYINSGTPYQPYSSTNKPDLTANSLWFRTNSSTPYTSSSNFNPSNSTVAVSNMNYGYNYPLWIQNLTGASGSGLQGNRATEQPLLIPVLQIRFPSIQPSNNLSLSYNSDTGNSGNGPLVGNWSQIATNTEANLVFASGDTPGRPPLGTTVGESSGLENFVRLLESWGYSGGSSGTSFNLSIQGSFIQFKRSSYATAPFQTIANSASASTCNGNSTSTSCPQPTSIFGGGISSSNTAGGYGQGYNNFTGSGRSPFYVAPNRFWGYDVALLTQLPDLFSQRFTSPSSNPPNEFYREVARSDNWVTTLLCATQGLSGGYGAGVTTSTNYGPGYQYAISSDQRGSCS